VEHTSLDTIGSLAITIRCGSYLTHPPALSSVKTAIVLHNFPIIRYDHLFLIFNLNCWC
jgi:hypothetical protein